MRVLLDATYAARAPYSGTGTYIDRIADALSRLDGVELEVESNRRRRPPAGGGLGSARNLSTDWWWTAVELPRLARRAGADLIHHPLPALAPRAPVPQLITVHDLAFERVPAQFARRFRLYAHATHRAAARGAAAVICVSRTTAADVESLWGVPGRRIVVARHGPGQEIEHAERERGRAERERGDAERERGHFLYVGDAEPRKNVSTLIAAYRRYRELADTPLPLVLAGSASPEGPDEPGVRAERRPSREQLADLFAAAVALIQPSLYEGFGLTALEAMSAGAPVLAADVPGLREVCGDAARYADPHDPASFAAGMGEIASEPRLRDDLAARGRRRAADFSWAVSARAHLDAYSLALEKS